MGTVPDLLRCVYNIRSEQQEFFCLVEKKSQD